MSTAAADVPAATIAALLAQCQLDPALAGCTFDSRVPDGTKPAKYAVLYLQHSVIYERAGASEPIAFDWLLTVHEVGLDVPQARLVIAAVARQLAGFRIAVDGWRQTRCRLIDSEPIDFDTAVQPPIAYGMDQFTWRSDAA